MWHMDVTYNYKQKQKALRELACIQRYFSDRAKKEYIYPSIGDTVHSFVKEVRARFKHNQQALRWAQQKSDIEVSTIAKNSPYYLQILLKYSLSTYDYTMDDPIYVIKYPLRKLP